MTPILVLAAALVQAPAPPPPDDDSARLERIRQALAHDPAITTSAETDDTGRPVFRMSVRAPKPDTPLWDNWTNVPSYIRPNMPGYHYYYFQMVTPEEFRGGTFNAMTIPIGPLLEALGRQMWQPHRKSREERAREEVRQALDDLLACRADSARPGC